MTKTNNENFDIAKALIWAACRAGKKSASGVDGSITLRDGSTLEMTFMTPDGSAPKAPEDVEYVLVGGPCWTLWIGGTIDELAKNLAREDELKAEWEKDAAVLAGLYAKGSSERTPLSSEEYSLYSDFHKDVFGYRPRGWQYDPLGNAATSAVSLRGGDAR